MSIKNIFRLGTIAAGLLAAINAGHASPGTKEQVEEYLELEGQYLYYPGKSAAAKTEIPMTHLVIGSTRSSQRARPYMGKIPGEENENLSHLKTFSGNATTVDLEPCHLLEARHLQADAAIHSFPEGIKRVYSERLAPGDIFSYNLNERFLENITPKLAPSAVVEIEWQPWFSIDDSPKTKKLKEKYKDLFFGFFDWKIINTAVRMAAFDLENVKGCSMDVLRAARTDVPLIKKLIASYSQRLNMSEQSLKQHLQREETLFDQFSKYSHDCKFFLNMGQASLNNIKNFTEFFEQFYQKKGLCFKEINIPNPESSYIYKGEEYYNSTGFFRKTIYSHILSDMTVIKNSPNVKSYLEKLGFTDVRIQQTVNPHNGRQHVWMIRAFKP